MLTGSWEGALIALKTTNKRDCLQPGSNRKSRLKANSDFSPFVPKTMKILRVYPMEATINGQIYRYEKILKDDFFSVNVLYKNDQSERYVLKLSDFRFVLGLLFRPLAVLMSRREYKIYQMVADISGVPQLGPRFGLRGYFHEFIEGKTLHELTEDHRLRDDFFDRLRTIVDEVHRRRIFYADLNKLGNIIVSEEGDPYLIDFQICIPFKKRNGRFGRLSDRVLESLIQIRHIYKHKKRFLKEQLSKEEDLLTTRSKLNRRYDRYWGSPARKVKRWIYPAGSNEMIWYKWKRMRDQSKRMP
jgi:serine/threonine protein kinase